MLVGNCAYWLCYKVFITVGQFLLSVINGFGEIIIKRLVIMQQHLMVWKHSDLRWQLEETSFLQFSKYRSNAITIKSRTT